MRAALVVLLVMLALMQVPVTAALAEGLVAPSGAAAELRASIQRECLRDTRQPWPYGPDDDLRGALFEGRSTKGFLIGTDSTVKPAAEDKDGALTPAEDVAEGVAASETDAFVFCLLLSGYHWQSSDEDGVATLRRLAEGGHRGAQTTLGAAHYYGRFVKSDHNEAVRWFRRAAEQGHMTGELYLGMAYANGEGVAPDWEEAMRWLHMAAAQGDRRAVDFLGQIRKKLEERGAPPTQSDIERVRRRAEHGDPRAQLALGVFYQDGRGVKRDIAEALRWYRTAAERGNPQAQNYLGVVYEKGRGVQQDDAAAIGWYRRAAEQGFPLAQYNLGMLLLKGRGAQLDEGQAWTWIRRAAERGEPRAQEALRRKR